MKDLIGKQFYRLTILERVRVKGRTKYLCLCDCGKKTIAQTPSSGKTKSCGCWYKETRKTISRTHGMSGTRQYKAWINMKQRCHRKAHPNYHNYGGRGIKVCEEWMSDFGLFYAHIGPIPSQKHEVDRIDTNGNYEPGNVRWVTHRENCQNQR